MTTQQVSRHQAVASRDVHAKPLRSDTPWTLLVVAAIQASLSIALAFTAETDTRIAWGYLRPDATARLFLVVMNVIFLGIASYVWSRARTEPALRAEVARFSRLSTLFMVAANVVVLSNHLIAGWIALETTTLLAAPLIVRRGVPSSRRASWRYFLFSSIGLAFALLGFACLARSLEINGHAPTYFIDELSTLVGGPPNLWSRIVLAFIVLGYGTKLGLAPLYSWLPSEGSRA